MHSQFVLIMQILLLVLSNLSGGSQFLNRKTSYSGTQFLQDQNAFGKRSFHWFKQQWHAHMKGGINAN